MIVKPELLTVEQALGTHSPLQRYMHRPGQLFAIVNVRCVAIRSHSLCTPVILVVSLTLPLHTGGKTLRIRITAGLSYVLSIFLRNGIQAVKTAFA